MCLEIYVKLDSMAGKGIIRIWRNGVLIISDTKHATLPNKSSAAADTALFMTYWNGGAPQKQIQYIDDVVITSDEPSNGDADGNHMIGPSDWGGGKSTVLVFPNSKHRRGKFVVFLMHYR